MFIERRETSYVRIYILWTLAANHLHWRARPLRSCTAIQLEAGLFCGTYLRKGEVFAYAGSIQTLKE